MKDIWKKGLRTHLGKAVIVGLSFGIIFSWRLRDIASLGLIDYRGSGLEERQETG